MFIASTTNYSSSSSGDPNVLFAEDDGMEMDAEEEPEDEEVEPWEDDHGDGVFDVDNGHFEE